MTDRDDKNPRPDEETATDEPEFTDEELREARALGDSLDRVLAGDLPHDELDAVALMVHSSARPRELSPLRRDDLVDRAMAEAGQARRTRILRRVAPAVVALAASVLLVVTGTMMTGTSGNAPATRATVAHTADPSTLSRSSDDLMGRPFTDRAGASRRLDTVFADRMRGYRMVVLAERGQP